MIVDAHHHLWAAAAGYSWLDEPGLEPINRTFTPADLVTELSAAGVERSVLVEGGRCDPVEAVLLLGHAAATPAIAGVVAWADPAAPDLAETLAVYRALPGGELLVGIRAQVQGEERDYLDRPDVRAGLAVIGAAGLVFDLVVRADQLPSAARVAAALPSVSFVLDHLGKPPIKEGGFARWSADLASLAACPNVTAKVSGLVTEADWQHWTVADLRPYVSEALRLFGPSRLMLGSDWPVCLLAGGYGAVRSALLDALGDLPAPERAAILGDTATRVYRLPA
ncbi:L-fuconolactonase [Asanoa hainanensis]|uniref:L-fuconolactonase n=1 Tax=Asanoa hainanensis TaxID=560556 RepID=A0A239NT73_9ACTN|nr:amidohydrolase family protein [Asanoa hainanensis]SNT58045.1 L-fuconolactonase [Asanoa hainanensis]